MSYIVRLERMYKSRLTDCSLTYSPWWHLQRAGLNFLVLELVQRIINLTRYLHVLWWPPCVRKELTRGLTSASASLTACPLNQVQE
jgi:hypothetical protein